RITEALSARSHSFTLLDLHESVSPLPRTERSSLKKQGCPYANRKAPKRGYNEDGAGRDLPAFPIPRIRHGWHPDPAGSRTRVKWLYWGRQAFNLPKRAHVDIGISTWVWTSPATSEKLEALIPHISSLGYDVVELPVETPGDFDVGRARDLADEYGLALSVCAVIAAGRDLVLPDERRNGIDYLTACIDIAEAAGSPTRVGPFYSAVGRCWLATPAERARDVA